MSKVKLDEDLIALIWEELTIVLRYNMPSPEQSKRIKELLDDIEEAWDK